MLHSIQNGILSLVYLVENVKQTHEFKNFSIPGQFSQASMLNTTIPIVATLYLETFKVLKQRRSKHTKIMSNHIKLKLGIMMKGFCLKLVGFKESCYSGKKGHRSVSFWERNSKLGR